MTNSLASSQLSKLFKECSECTKCPLHEGRVKCVFGDGPSDANVMIIGEAPGKNENETGKPFVGKAGENLNSFLQLAGIKRSDVYIANVIKCRPPSNRDPKAEEIVACSKYLRQQTKIVDPKIIITLGNFATKFILKTEKGISLLHGQQMQLDKYIVFPVFHPAACIYDPKKKDQLEKDFVLLKAIIKDICF